MSEATLTSLLEYLYGTLSPSNQRWVGEHLVKHANAQVENPKPYTMQEIHSILDQAKRDFEAGLGIPDEEVWRKIDEEYTQEEVMQLETA